MTKYKIYNEDCLKGLDKIAENSIDLLLTDPPYNLGLFMKKRSANLGNMRENFFVDAGWDNIPEEEWLTLMNSFFEKVAKVLKPGANAVIFMASIKLESLVEIALKHGFYYKTTGIWHKTNPMPLNMKLHFANSIEPWLYFVFEARTGTFNNNGKLLHNHIETSGISMSERKHGKHPTQKPVNLLKFFVEVLSNEGDTVLDPFMGSGSTGVASVELRRKFVGVELSEEYFNLSKTRLENIQQTLF